MDIIDASNRYKILYKNYISVMWNIRRWKNKIKVIFRNGNSNYVNNNFIANYALLIANKNVNITSLDPNSNNIKFTYNGKNIVIENDTGAIGEVFGREGYHFLEAKNDIVLDIGANIGDSPIYFALNNAKKVIALEPYPYSYNITLKNIRKIIYLIK